MRLSTREVNLAFQCRYCNTWPKAIRLVESRLGDLKSLVTHRFQVEEAKEAFGTAADLATGALKVSRCEEGDICSKLNGTLVRGMASQVVKLN